MPLGVRVHRAGGWLPRCASSSYEVVARDRRAATRVVPRENGPMSGSRPSAGTGAVCVKRPASLHRTMADLREGASSERYAVGNR